MKRGGEEDGEEEEVKGLQVIEKCGEDGGGA